MGRYTTVQAFKDTDTRVPALSYELATGKVADKETGELVEKSPKSKEELYDEHGRKKGLTEKVVNAYGSTAGAGSGEYHTYRHARDRENRRLERNEQIKKKAEQKAVRAILGVFCVHEQIYLKSSPLFRNGSCDWLAIRRNATRKLRSAEKSAKEKRRFVVVWNSDTVFVTGAFIIDVLDCRQSVSQRLERKLTQRRDFLMTPQSRKQARRLARSTLARRTLDLVVTCVLSHPLRRKNQNFVSDAGSRRQKAHKNCGVRGTSSQ